MKMASGILGMAMLLFASIAGAQIEIPPAGRLVDEAGVLSPQQIQSLDSKLETVETETGAMIQILVVPSLQGMSVARYATHVEQV